MLFKLSSYIFKVNKNDRFTIRALCSAFRSNARMQALLGSQRQHFERKLKILISFCYFMVKKLDGIFVSQNRSAFLLYYQKSKHYFSVRDMLHYIYMAINVIGISRIGSAFKREQIVKKIRNEKLAAHKEKDYLYVWFLAQIQEKRSLSALVEAKMHLFEKAKQLQLPVYMETTEARLVAFYKRLGFSFYETYHDQNADVKIWFGRMTVAEMVW